MSHMSHPWLSYESHEFPSCEKISEYCLQKNATLMNFLMILETFN